MLPACEHDRHFLVWTLEAWSEEASIFRVVQLAPIPHARHQVSIAFAPLRGHVLSPSALWVVPAEHIPLLAVFPMFCGPNLYAPGPWVLFEGAATFFRNIGTKHYSAAVVVI